MVLFIITGNTCSTDQTLAANRSDVEQQRPIEYREVPERQNCDRTRPMACDQTLAASDQLIVALMVGMTGRVRSGRDQRPVSSRKAGFCPPTATFSVGLINRPPNRPFEESGAEETYLGC